MKRLEPNSFDSFSGNGPPERVRKSEDPIKQCTKCLARKPSKDFYSKGKRRSSKCKQCEKEEKKTNYVARKNCMDVTTLKRMFDIIYCHQILQVQSEIEKLDEVIANAKSK